MFTRKFQILFVFLVIGALIFASCTPMEEPAVEEPVEEVEEPEEVVEEEEEPIDVSLRLAWIINAQAAGPFVALEKGYFADEGLNVTINAGGPDANSITLVAAGSDTYGLHDTNSLVQAEAEGVSLVTVATFWERHPGCVITTTDAGITELSDFSGKRLGFKEGGPWTLTKAMLRKNGVDPDSMEQISIGFGVAPILEDQVDMMTGFCTNENLAVAREGKEVITFLPSDYGVETSTEALFTSRSFHAENPEVSCKMVRAIQKGWEYALANKEEAIDIVIKYGGEELDFDLQLQQLIAQEDFIVTAESEEFGIGHMSPERWQNAHDVLLAEGELAEAVDISEVFDMSCWE